MRSLSKQQMDYCTYCPKMCRFSCPVSETTKHESHTPWGKMQLAGMLLSGKMPWSRDEASILYQCTSCARCQNYCEHDNQVAPALWEARAVAVDHHVAPESVMGLGKNFDRFGNPYAKRLRPPSLSEDFPTAPHEAAVVFFPSCHTLRYYPERLKVYAQLFRKLGIREVKIVEENLLCCGAPLSTLGWAKKFAEAHEIHYHTLKSASWVVSDEAECASTLQAPVDGRLNKSLKVMHLLEFLAPYLKASNYQTRPQTPARLVFHDGSFLARGLALAPLARQVLEAMTGLEPMNLALSGKDTWGSGAEGGYAWVDAKHSEKISKQVLSELEGRRLKHLITASPQAEAQFKRLTKRLQIQDLFEFLNEQILEE